MNSVATAAVAATPRTAWFESLWMPLSGGLLTLILGGLGFAFGSPWLFPSVGASAFIQASVPHQQTARFYNTVIGHLIGLLAGLLAVAVCGAGTEPAVLAAHQMFPRRTLASALAVALTLLGQMRFKALHAPAAATTLLVTLGAFKSNWSDSLIILGSVVAVAAAGSGLRRIRIAPEIVR